MSLFSKKFKSLSMNKAISELQQNSEIVLVDVRTKEEYTSGRIPKSVNIPIENLQAVLKKIPNKDTPLFVYCLSGGRSIQASGMLYQLGYTNVTNIGGIMSYNGAIER